MLYVDLIPSSRRVPRFIDIHRVCSNSIFSIIESICISELKLAGSAKISRKGVGNLPCR